MECLLNINNSRYLFQINRCLPNCHSLGSRVAQLVERSLPTPQVRGLNPFIGKRLSVYCQLLRKDENKGKEAVKERLFNLQRCYLIGTCQIIYRCTLALKPLLNYSFRFLLDLYLGV